MAGEGWRPEFSSTGPGTPRVQIDEGRPDQFPAGAIRPTARDEVPAILGGRGLSGPLARSQVECGRVTWAQKTSSVKWLPLYQPFLFQSCQPCGWRKMPRTR